MILNNAKNKLSQHTLDPMKKLFTLVCLLLTLSTRLAAQTDVSLSMGAGYANNIWYNLEDGQTGSASATNWDIALAATASQSSPLTTSILFNTKVGKLYAVPSTTPAQFSTVDTAGLGASWTPLYNDPTTWTSGAFNRPSAGGLDYGWGAYNMSSHNVEANRVFVIKYTSGTVKKLYITLNSMAGTYSLTYDNYDNSDPRTETITIATYNTKNFVFYSLSSNSILDREPAAANWDLLLTQYFDMYPANAPTSMQQVGGILHNLGVEVAQAVDVDQETYEDYAALTFSPDINSIGYDWKNLNYSSFLYETEDQWIYFVKRKNNDIWKVVLTEFVGTSNGNYGFTKEKIHTATTGILSASAQNNNNLVLYPNPTTGETTTVLYTADQAEESTLEVYDLSGVAIQQWAIHAQAGLNAFTVSTNTLKSGIYMIAVRSAQKVSQQKLIVQ